MKRNAESRYRIKLIQEMNLNKSEQKYVDDYKQHKNVSYKNLYDKTKFGRFSVYNCTGGRVAVGLKRFRTAIVSISQALSDFGNLYKQ